MPAYITLRFLTHASFPTQLMDQVPSRDMYDDAIAARTGESRTLTSSGYQGEGTRVWQTGTGLGS